MAGKFDDMSFSKAFAAARKEMGKGGTFTWKGKSYTTNYKEEVAPKAPAKPSMDGGARRPMVAGSKAVTMGGMKDATPVVSKKSAEERKKQVARKEKATKGAAFAADGSISRGRYAKGGMVKKGK